MCIGDNLGKSECLHSKILGDGRINKTNLNELIQKVDNFINC